MTIANSNAHTHISKNLQDQDKQANATKKKPPWWKRIGDLFSQPKETLDSYEQAIFQQRLADEYEKHIQYTQKIGNSNIGFSRNPVQRSTSIRIELP